MAEPTGPAGAGQVVQTIETVGQEAAPPQPDLMLVHTDHRADLT